MRFRLFAFFFCCLPILSVSIRDGCFVARPLLSAASRRPSKLTCLRREHHDRRTFAILAIQSACRWTAITPIVASFPSAAAESRAPVKPFAPLESLLPAARVKKVVDRSLAILSEIESGASDGKELTIELKGTLLTPQNFTRSPRLEDVPRLPARQYLASYRRRLGELPPLERPGAFLEQRGEIGAWRDLKRREREREGEDEIRAAFNAYTGALTFDAESYAFNAPREVRSRLIREDRLPDAKAVIASDMGVRYLYRNEVLTAMEEARAELAYQLSQEDLDWTELVQLLRRAQKACDSWFHLIDEKDVQEAMYAIENE